MVSSFQFTHILQRLVTSTYLNSRKEYRELNKRDLPLFILILFLTFDRYTIINRRIRTDDYSVENSINASHYFAYHTSNCIYFEN